MELVLELVIYGGSNSGEDSIVSSFSGFCAYSTQLHSYEVIDKQLQSLFLFKNKVL